MVRRPLVMVAGSLDPERAVELKLRPGAMPHATSACEAIGEGLARSGYDLLVFSSDAMFIEPAVVRGYARGTTDETPGRVEVRIPSDLETDFGELDPTTDLDVIRDTVPDWEVSYYRAIFDADAVILVGGGEATLLTGLLALAREIPVLPVGAFGGRSDAFRGQARHSPLMTKEEFDRLGDDWRPERSAGELITMLGAQLARRARALASAATDREAAAAAAREAERERAATERAAARRQARANSAALGFVVCTVVVSAVVLAMATQAARATVWWFALTVPLLVAAAGALLKASARREDWGWSVASGLFAGLLSELAFLITEWFAVDDYAERADPFKMLLSLIVIAGAAGFTFDTVLQKIRSGEFRLPGTPPPETHPPGTQLPGTQPPGTPAGGPGGNAPPA
ncbi:hypothetical protein [Cryptosporangium sp. NPDC051539]|uniref:hypothetical protein n=1 Tax=Cryptosporangium sp. NPDC051539 TaxID=3363962 RepID=UPI0037975FA8